MAKRLFLLDGMALVYRAHFALIARPILTSKGLNTSALFGFTQTLLEILNKQQPTHIAVAFDTAAPTKRHVEFPDYKANRQEMPEDLSAALPHVRRMIDAFRIPVLLRDGFEADDIIGTIVSRAGPAGFTSYMVTPDKDFGQLVTENVLLFKPARMGDAPEILGPAQICERWGIKQPAQVIDVLALMGDSSDNIPGVPGIGEKTAIKLVSQYGSLQGVLDHAAELPARARDSLEKHRELALLSRRLATIDCEVPCEVDLEALKVQPADDDQLRALMVEFEFNFLGRKLFGEGFKAGRGFAAAPPSAGGEEMPASVRTTEPQELELDLGGGSAKPEAGAGGALKTLADTPHQYDVLATREARAALIRKLEGLQDFAFVAQADGADPKSARLLGLAFAFEAHKAAYVPVSKVRAEAQAILEEFRPVLESDRAGKVGHDLKFSLSVMKWQGVTIGGRIFDTLVAHSLVEPDMRHTLEQVCESSLGYTPMSPRALSSASSKSSAKAESPEGTPDLAMISPERKAEQAAEAADLAWQLRRHPGTAARTSWPTPGLLRNRSAACAGARGDGTRRHPAGCGRAGRIRNAVGQGN